MQISQADLATAKIADTDVTVQDLINSLCEFMDGTQDHDIHNATGLDEAGVAMVAKTRAAARRFWTSDGKLVITS